MKITEHINHSEVESAIRQKLIERIKKLGEKYNWISGCDLFYKEEKKDSDQEKVIEILLKIPGSELYNKSKELNFQLASKNAIAGIKRQLEKHKEKAFGHPVNNPLKS